MFIPAVFPHTGGGTQNSWSCMMNSKFSLKSKQIRHKLSDRFRSKEKLRVRAKSSKVVRSVMKWWSKCISMARNVDEDEGRSGTMIHYYHIIIA